MKVTQVVEIKGRGLVVTVSAPIRGLTVGWVLGCGDRSWSISFIEEMGGRMRAAKVAGLGLVSLDGLGPPNVGDDLVVKANRVSLR